MADNLANSEYSMSIRNKIATKITISFKTSRKNQQLPTRFLNVVKSHPRAIMPSYMTTAIIRYSKYLRSFYPWIFYYYAMLAFIAFHEHDGITS